MRVKLTRHSFSRLPGTGDMHTFRERGSLKTPKIIITVRGSVKGALVYPLAGRRPKCGEALMNRDAVRNMDQDRALNLVVPCPKAQFLRFVTFSPRGSKWHPTNISNRTST